MTGTGDKRNADRAEDLLPEERAGGSDDPVAQADAILTDSDERAIAADHSDDADGTAEAGGDGT